MKLQEIKSLDIAGKKIFIRCDFNVPMDEYFNITDDRRIKSALNTIRYCIDNDCAVILASHFGRPKDKYDERYSLKPIAKRFHTLIKQIREVRAQLAIAPQEKILGFSTPANAFP